MVSDMRQRNDADPRIRDRRLRRTADAQGYYIVKANRDGIWFLLDAEKRTNVAYVCYSLDEVENALVNPATINDGAACKTVASGDRVSPAA